MVSALSDSQTLRIQWFERWLFSLDETRTSSAVSFSCTTNTMVSAPWCISLYKCTTFGPGECSAGGFRALKPLRVQFQTCLMNCSRARSTCFVGRNRIRARRRSSIGSSKKHLLESAKRKKYLFCQTKRGRNFVDQSNTNRIPDARNSALDRHLSTQMHFGSAEIRTRSTPVNPNAIPEC